MNARQAWMTVTLMLRAPTLTAVLRAPAIWATPAVEQPALVTHGKYEIIAV